jgi:serine/threonine-protein phosphatase PPG1
VINKLVLAFLIRYRLFGCLNSSTNYCIGRLYRKELLAESVVEAICAKAKQLLMKESNVVHIAAPATVVGDIHGQFFDMIEIFKIGGFCPNTNYLFLCSIYASPFISELYL